MPQGKTVRRTICIIAVGSALFLPGLSHSMDASDAPEMVTIENLSNLYGAVEFSHLAHTEMATCADCHHHTVGTVPTRWNCVKCHETYKEVDIISCGECHPRDRFGSEYLSTLDDPELFHKEKPGLKGAYHLNCVGCHQEVGGPTGCEDCHSITDAGEKLFHSGSYSPTSDQGEKSGH